MAVFDMLTKRNNMAIAFHIHIKTNKMATVFTYSLIKRNNMDTVFDMLIKRNNMATVFSIRYAYKEE